MKKKIFFIILTLFFFSKGNTQVLDPVKWTTEIEKTANDTYILTFNGQIEKGWHVYSQFTAPGGSLPLELIFKTPKDQFSLVGKAKESKTKTGYNDIFEVNETYFENKATIKQEIKLKNNSLKQIETVLNYQACKEVCVNLEKKFSFKIPAPGSNALAITVKDTVAEKSTDTLNATLETKQLQTQKIEKAAPTLAYSTPEKSSEKGLLSIFLIAFLSGFAALLTPCVFPMIPMTVSFFTKQSKTRAAGIRNAFVYGLSIILIYVVLGLAISSIFGAGALNKLATNVWFNLVFFVLLIVFALSFLGAFELVLPNSWANKVDNQADKGGIAGILFMALALAIVSFSCTGPIVGTLLVQAASTGGIAPIVGMFGFSLAMALPFMLFALFPSWLQTLPKSGGWLNTVKVVLGFLELALAFKFLSNADLVLQLHLLEREVFLAIWIAVFGSLALYLFGKIRLPHDSDLATISVGRLMLGMIVLAFTVYMIPGLWGAPVKLISAFTPSLEYSENKNSLQINAKTTDTALPEGAKIGVHGLVVFEDYDKGLAYAKTVNKPILLDFTGYACVNCRKMETNVWSETEVLSILKNKVVLISLYVDDNRKLPENEQFLSKTTGNKIETIGDKWTDFVISKYKTNTQPLYVLTDLEGNSLNKNQPTISYVSVKDYFNWLNTGIEAF